MSLALAHCWKEWRTQRAVLLAYAGLVFASLCLGFTLVPEHWWLEDGRRALALSWFVAAGVIGVVGFAAPALVRGEFGAKDDQFVRRLPGALGPSFGGKLVFLVLATLAFPLVGLLWGEGFLLAIHEPWHDLFASTHQGDVFFRWPWPVEAIGCAALLTPWVWAIGTWLPGGRMAIGGTVLLGLLLGICVFAVCRQNPQLEKGIEWRPWLWAVAPFGLAVAGLSWIVGRRGGGAPRSARFGVGMLALVCTPPAAWLGTECWRYHHPDPQRSVGINVWGLSPDGRFALAGGTEQEQWPAATFRIDLATGDAHQVGGVMTAFTPELLEVSPMRAQSIQRFWRSFRWDAWGQCIVDHDVFDLATGERTCIDFDREQHLPVLPLQLQARVAAEARGATTFAAPGGRRAWIEAEQLCIEGPDRVLVRMPWTRDDGKLVRAAGHGLRGFATKRQTLFDLTERRFVPEIPRLAVAHFVKGTLVYNLETELARGTWWRRRGDELAERCTDLEPCQVLGLFDDDRLLCASLPRRGGAIAVFVWHVADRSSEPLSLLDAKPVRGVRAAFPLGREGALLPRDPAGCIWLTAEQAGRQGFLRIDVATRQVVRVPVPKGREAPGRQLMQWLDERSVLVSERASIVRVDIATGASTVLFPRPIAAEAP